MTVEGLRLCDFFTRKPLSSDYKLYLTGQSILNEPALHLPETVNSASIFPDVDADGDGFVDGTQIPYDDVVSNRGVVDPDNHTNFNPITPPRDIRYIHSEGTPEILAPDTSVYADGGFFGSTEFVTEEGTVVGTSSSIGGFSFKPIASLKMD